LGDVVELLLVVVCIIDSRSETKTFVIQKHAREEKK
jgi:hypothetical protein